MAQNRKIRLSSNLKALREISGGTQVSVSNDLGITRSRYANWEQGTDGPTLKMLIKLGSYYNVSLDILVFGNINIKSKR